MCIAAVAWRAHPKWPLCILANRDERHDREAAPLASWGDGSGIVAGRDLESGGTWLGMSEAGRFALITNVHDPDARHPAPPSRGALVTDWLARGKRPDDARRYDPFNLIVGDSHGCRWITNNPAEATAELPPGIHGVSNGPMSAPWPKVRSLNATLAEGLASGNIDPARMLDVLGPRPEHSDDPRHGIFIRDPAYGTRCSTVVAVGEDGRGWIVERRYDARANAIGTTRIEFPFQAINGAFPQGAVSP